MGDDDNTYMGAVKDRVGDLAHRAYDAVSGVLSSASAPNKPAASEIAIDPISAARTQYQKRQNDMIDKAVTDAGG